MFFSQPEDRVGKLPVIRLCMLALLMAASGAQIYASSEDRTPIISKNSDYDPPPYYDDIYTSSEELDIDGVRYTVRHIADIPPAVVNDLPGEQFTDFAYALEDINDCRPGDYLKGHITFSEYSVDLTKRADYGAELLFFPKGLNTPTTKDRVILVPQKLKKLNTDISAMASTDTLTPPTRPLSNSNARPRSFYTSLLKPERMSESSSFSTVFTLVNPNGIHEKNTYAYTTLKHKPNTFLDLGPSRKLKNFKDTFGSVTLRFTVTPRSVLTQITPAGASNGASYKYKIARSTFDLVFTPEGKKKVCSDSFSTSFIATDGTIVNVQIGVFQGKLSCYISTPSDAQIIRQLSEQYPPYLSAVSTSSSHMDRVRKKVSETAKTTFKQWRNTYEVKVSWTDPTGRVHTVGKFSQWWGNVPPFMGSTSLPWYMSEQDYKEFLASIGEETATFDIQITPTQQNRSHRPLQPEEQKPLLPQPIRPHIVDAFRELQLTAPPHPPKNK